ncbi:MAG: 4-alpha-glucanotransferase [Candidatus Omnitrophica bacterium]|nr:4-alpha-glucanotransferase [Candidatus Omnitrophota bacterium]
MERIVKTSDGMYQSFLSSISAGPWKRLGLERRSGVAVPLFSVYSGRSIGVGELPDLKLLIDWCGKTGMSIIQFLPLNDVGFNFAPYDAQSSFALEPMYLAVDRLAKANIKPFKNEIESLRKTFAIPSPSPLPSGERVRGEGIKRVDYKIKAAKLDLLWKIFEKSKAEAGTPFMSYVEKNKWWLDDYALFKVIKEKEGERKWEDWPTEFKRRNFDVIGLFEKEHADRITFHKWLQWQLFEQFQDARKYARSKKVLFMGDLPFLASRDSADVWAHPRYFKLDLSSGAPPDAYFFKGQRWGTPPCDWEALRDGAYDYVIEKLKYASNFYDLLRMDHSVGFFRLWSIPLSEPIENAGLNGFFDPSDERIWEERGRSLFSLMVQNCKMLICGEDLGTVPECSFRVLEACAIPGMDIQRWMREPAQAYAFKPSEAYRRNSIAAISTHDMSSFNAWWEYEAGTVYGPLFERKLNAKGIDLDPVKHQLFDLDRSFHDRLRWRNEIKNVQSLVQIIGKPEHEMQDLIDLYLWSYGEKEKFWRYVGLPGCFDEKSSHDSVKASLEKIMGSASIFAVQLFQDWLALGDYFEGDSWDVRINFPGIASEKNWSFVMPISLEQLNVLSINKEIKAINKLAGRV